MTVIKEGDTVADIAEWFETARPKPTQDNFRVQLGVHFEEVAEMLETLKANDRTTQAMLTQAMIANHALAMQLKSVKSYIAVLGRKELLDALADQIVTATGVAYEANLDIVNGLEEVSLSNWSKFVDGKPMFDANGKIAKGPNYVKAELDQYVGPDPWY